MRKFIQFLIASVLTMGWLYTTYVVGNYIIQRHMIGDEKWLIYVLSGMLVLAVFAVWNIFYSMIDDTITPNTTDNIPKIPE